MHVQDPRHRTKCEIDALALCTREAGEEQPRRAGARCEPRCEVGGPYPEGQDDALDLEQVAHLLRGRLAERRCERGTPQRQLRQAAVQRLVAELLRRRMSQRRHQRALPRETCREGRRRCQRVDDVVLLPSEHWKRPYAEGLDDRDASLLQPLPAKVREPVHRDAVGLLPHRGAVGPGDQVDVVALSLQPPREIGEVALAAPRYVIPVERVQEGQPQGCRHAPPPPLSTPPVRTPRA
jgi:hypothetical protein